MFAICKSKDTKQFGRKVSETLDSTKKEKKKKKKESN